MLFVYLFMCLVVHYLLVALPRFVPGALKAAAEIRGKRSHTRNRRLGKHRGFQCQFPMDFSGIFQHKLTCQYVPKDCHLSSGFLLELSNGLSAAFSNGFSCL